VIGSTTSQRRDREDSRLRPAGGARDELREQVKKSRIHQTANEIPG
jgi:hypothetical protein